MKVKMRICDVCGKPIYQHGHHTYTIKKRFWEIGDYWVPRLDICETCWEEFVAKMNKTFLASKKDKRARMDGGENG